MGKIQHVARMVKGRTVDWVGACVLSALIGWCVCWVGLDIRHIEREGVILSYANRNWNTVYNDLAQSCVPLD